MADASIRAFQTKLLNVLETGYTTLLSHGEAHESVHTSLAYFDGLRPLLTGLTGTRYTGPFGAYVAERVGVPNVTFDLTGTPNNFEYQPFINRHQLLRMAAWLFEDWPERSVQACAQTEMAPSYLLGDIGEVPAWLEDAVASGQEEKRQQALVRPRGYLYIEVSEEAKETLRDFLEHGAERPGIAQARYPALQRLLDTRCLKRINTPLGETVTISGRGKQKLGQGHNESTSPKNAAGQIMRRRVREKLEAEGWTYLGQEARNLVSFSSPEGKKRYLLCGYG